MVEFIGNMAAVLTTTAFLPQVIKTLKSKSTDDMSWSWLLMFITGVFLWLIYGLSINVFPITAANAFTFVCLLILLFIKVNNLLKSR